MIQKIIVLGGGSAGLLAGLAVKKKLPGIDVQIIRSSQIGIIGVGEGTTFTIPNYLHGYLGIAPKPFHRAVNPTFKLGIRFLWGPRPYFHYTFTNQLDARFASLPKPNGFYCHENYDFGDLNGALMASGCAFEKQSDGGPLINTDVAYHLENTRFVAFLETCANELGLPLLDDTVASVEQDERGITALNLASGRQATADLYIDCSGFRSELLARALNEPFIPFRSSLFCDRAAIGGWSRTDEPLLPYTTAETMNSGWCWQIEHDDWINRGYVFSSDFISDEEAERELRQKNPKIESVRLLRFTSGRYRNAWVKNVVAIGNASGFVEPLEATAIAVICDHTAALVRTLRDSDLTIRPSQRDCYNQYTSANWDAIRRFLAIHYKFNTRLDTAFWRSCRADTDVRDAQPIIDFFKENGPSLNWASVLLGPTDPFGWEGYLSMLVGQQVPYECSHVPSVEENNLWNRTQQALRERASQAISQEEALKIIRSESWDWRPDFYAKASRF